MSQVQTNEERLILGSADVLIGDDVDSLVSVGGCDEVGFDFEGEAQEIVWDNADPITKISRKNALVKFTWGEILVEKIKGIFGHAGDTYETIAGTEVTGQEDSYSADSLVKFKFIPFKKQNGDGSAIDSAVIDCGSETLTEDTDYLIQEFEGKSGFMLLDTVDVDLTEEFKVTYDYTPSAAKVAKFSTGSYVPDYKFIRLLHTNAEGKKFIVDMPRAQNNNLLSFSFPAEGGAEVVKLPTEFKAVESESDGFCVKIYSELE